MKRIVSMTLVVVLIACLFPVSVSADSADLGLRTLESGETYQNMSVSDDMVTMIMDMEGFSATPYWDNSQWTIGYGSCLSTNSSANVSGVVWTAAQAKARLISDIDSVYGASVNSFCKKIGKQPTQQQFDALVSFTYNLGGSWMSGCRLSRWLQNPTTLDELINAMGIWCRSGGSINYTLCCRRVREIIVFLYGEYTLQNGSVTGAVSGKDTDLQVVSNGALPYIKFVIYKTNGGSFDSSVSKYSDYVLYYEKDDSGIEPPTVTKDGYALAGWTITREGNNKTSKGEAFTADTILSKNLEVTAQWADASEVFPVITTQPVSVKVGEGENATVTVGATGDSLTYEWYYSDDNGAKFYKTSAFTGNTYQVPMNSTRNGRMLYCVITNAYGNSVTTDTVTISMETKLAITTQPVSVKVAEGQNATVTVKATGDGLTYAWYYSDNNGAKFYKTSAYTGKTYKVSMTSARNGRMLYCVITDAYGNSVTTDTVTISMETKLAITTQPVSVKVAEGQNATVTVKAAGDSLTYAWYYSDNGGAKYYKTSAFTGNTYKVPMTSARNGRMLYCVITDAYGNSITTNTVTISMGTKLAITTQPVSAKVAEGQNATVTVKASGDGLTYEWYYSDNNGAKFYKTSAFTGNTYKVSMTSARNGRMLYCVITDAYGNSVTTNTVTISMK